MSIEQSPPGVQASNTIGYVKANEASHSVQTQDHRSADPTVPRPLPSAVSVPGYTILEVLGRGGMGVVYKARQDKANRLVALKMILTGAHAGDDERQRFQAEAEAVASLSHPHIVQVYEVGETPEGHSFFSLEFVAGGTLADRLQQGPLPPVEAAVVLEALARAVQYAHEHGIVHRDLTPRNLLLAADDSSSVVSRSTLKLGHNVSLGAGLKSEHAVGPPLAAIPKISDFGLAKRLDADESLTHTGAIMGTPNYMAPEQAAGQSKRVGPAADIYGLGVLLYECLTGRPPFKGATIAETLDQVRTMEPIAPHRFTKEVPRDLETICLHCLRKDPERRYASAELLADDLRCFREGRPISVRPVGNLERVWRWCRRNPRWAAMIAAVVLLLWGVTGVSLYAYFTVAAMNEDIQAKNDEVTKEIAEKEKQRQLEITEAAEKEKQRQLAITEAAEKEKQRQLAEKRLLQSIDAVSLFARDARIFCEDAMVPAGSRQQLYEVLIKQLEKSVDDKDVPFDEDRIRNKILMYQQIAQVNADLGGLDRLRKAREWDEKGLALTEQWIKEKPGDPAARSHHAAYVHL